MESKIPTTYVLGSSGYIGKELYSYLKVKYSGAVKSAGRKDCDIYVELAEDFSELVNLVSENDIVVFLSSISSPDICKQHPELAQKVNVLSTINLIEKLTVKGVRVIFTSTDIVFGNAKKAVNDNSSLAPFGDYGEMKANVEKAVVNNKLVKVVRFSYVLGEGDKYTSMMSGVAANKEVLEVFEGFERNVVVLDDVIEGIYQLINKWDSIESAAINFSGTELISRLKITELFNKHVCLNLKYEAVEAPLGFWRARPKTIEIKSNIFPALLGREPMTLEHKLKNWSVK
ncbi:sugar nucleotide-binding protein [Colwelliaceae bacterium MEBiC 14330]